jgi:hypothetical protein
MAEFTDPGTDHDNNRSLTISAPSIVPWSSRESFTQDVCGFPADRQGCWRCQHLPKDLVMPESRIYRGIPSGKPDSAINPLTWVVFTPKNEPKVSDRPPENPDEDFVAFGFAKPAVSGKLIPNCIESPLKGWESGDRSLSNAFGREAFKWVEIRDLGRVSLAELINSFMDSQCQFRGGSIGNDFGRESGIAMCKMELSLAEENWLDYASISFSFVDPRDFRVNTFDHLAIPTTPPADEISLLISELALTYNKFADLDNLSETGIDLPHFVSFADSLCSKGRRNIIPEEVGQSFLRFQIGEIVAYLLHWILLRIYSHECGPNQEFVALFDKWRQALSKREESGPLFRNLLDLKVVLPPDRNLVRVNSPEFTDLSKNALEQLAIFPEPISFDKVLRRTFGLSNDAVSRTRARVLEFLHGDFAPFASLPMYRNLSWTTSGEVSDNYPLHYGSSLEAVLAHFATASGLQGSRVAHAECKAHVQRCVFPIMHVLTHWRRDSTCTDYLIFPIWEELMRVNKDESEYFRPVIFAHVFADMEQGDTRSAASDEISWLQRAITPLGHSIAHSYYRRVSKNAEDVETAWGQTRAWAHEVKNYCGGPIDDLRNLEIRWGSVTDSDKRAKIRHARKSMLILSVCSSAVQEALSARVSSALTKNDGGLKKLNPAYGETLVLTVFDYLLDHRQSTLAFSRRTLVTCEGQRPISEVLSILSKIFGVSEEDALLTNGEVIWIVALLREVIWNIRNRKPPLNQRPPQGQAKIALRRKVILDPGQLSLHIYQKQEETGAPERGSVEKASGINNANLLFGVKGAGFGEILPLELEVTSSLPKHPEDALEVTYHSVVRFAVQ